HPVLAGRGVDPDDPQLAHLALPLLAVTGRIRHRVEARLASGLDETGLRAHPPLGGVEKSLVALVGGDAALDSCHGIRSLLEVGQQATDLLRVGADHERLAGVPPRTPRRLDLEVMAAPRLHAEHLATTGDAD